MVIGVIKERAGENYKVDINSPHTAILNLTSFDGATRRNRPDLRPGSLVYARMLGSHFGGELDPEISCISPPNASMGRKDWVTGLSMFGELKDGFMIHVSSGVCRQLLQRENVLLGLLGERVPFEIAVGLNGRVWVCAQESCILENTPTTATGGGTKVVNKEEVEAAHVRNTILIANAIQNAEFLTSTQQMKQMADQLFATGGGGSGSGGVSSSSAAPKKKKK